MATTLEALEIQFRADVGPLREELTALNGQLALTGAAALAANAGLSVLAASGVRGLSGGLQALIPELQSTGQKSGAALTAGVAAGLSRGLAAVRAAAVSAGRNTGLGFAQGLNSSQSAVLAAAARLANLAAAQLRSALKIHSPSRVMREAGEFAGAGFALGLGDELKKVEASARALALAGPQAADAEAGPVGTADLGLRVRALADAGDGVRSDAELVQAVRAAAQAALEGLEITVPLEVDGLRLGEACIRGINAVTRRTGRMQLEI